MYQTARFGSIAVFIGALFLWCTSAGAVVEARDVLTRPDPKGVPTEVQIGLYIIDIDKISAADQAFDAKIFIALQWKDPRLANPDIEKRRMKLDEIWHPRTMVTNLQRAFRSDILPARVSSDGTVRFRRYFMGHFSNAMRLERFPFDEHVFAIQFIPLGYTQSEVTFVFDVFKGYSGITDEPTVADWDISGFRGYPTTFKTSVQLEVGIPSFVFEFDAKRQSGYYIMKVFFPLLLIVFMSWLVFWIDPKNFATQIGISTTSMLTLIAYRFTLERLIPQISYLTLMDIILMGATCMVFAALAEAVFVSSLVTHEKLDLARKIDRISRFAFPSSFAIFLVVVLMF